MNRRPRPALRQIGTRREAFFGRARRIKRTIAPGEIQIGEAHAAAAARSAAAERVVFKQTQTFEHARRERFVLFAQDVEHHADAETRARPERVPTFADSPAM
jgi:hypothetical protein